MNNTEVIQELDLSIPDMHSPSEEASAGAALKGLPGITSVRLVARGALVHYDAAIISAAQICEVLRRVGFRATTYQDSATGKTGTSSV